MQGVVSTVVISWYIKAIVKRAGKNLTISTVNIAERGRELVEKRCSGMMEKTTSLLLDVMLDDRFYRQLKYSQKGVPIKIDGKTVMKYDLNDIKSFVEDRLPSIKGKNWRVVPSGQRI